MAPLVRTGGSRHTGLAAPPHRNIQYVCKRDNVRVFLSVGDKDGLNLKSAVKFTLEMLSGNIRGGELKDEE